MNDTFPYMIVLLLCVEIYILRTPLTLTLSFSLAYVEGPSISMMSFRGANTAPIPNYFYFFF
jgi:hypothetical protein